jgi:hypothetical protein
VAAIQVLLSGVVLWYHKALVIPTIELECSSSNENKQQQHHDEEKSSDDDNRNGRDAESSDDEAYNAVSVPLPK